MEPLDHIKGLIKKLHLKASADLDRRVHEDISRGSTKCEQLKSAGAQPAIWRTVMKTKTARFTIAAVAALVVIGGLTFWPGRGMNGKQWWLAPHAAWSQEIIDSLDTFKCVTCRERLINVEPDGSERIKSWMKKYSTHDRYRRDWYSKDKDIVGEIHWCVPDGSDMVQYTVRFDSESYSIGRRTGVVDPNSKRDPAEGARSCVEDMEKADRLLGTEVIEGRECVGFEIDKPVGSTRVWFDVETKLPARTEFRNQPRSPGSERRITIIRDQYDYDPGLTPDTFVPNIPEGFVPYQPGESQIDIAITDENLTVTEQPDGSFKAEIAVYNKGPDPSPKFTVVFYAVDPDKGKRFLARQAAGPVMPGEHVLSSHPGLELRLNESAISVTVKPHYIADESNKTNNKASAVITGRQAKKLVEGPAPTKPADSGESKVPTDMVGTWFFDNPEGNDEQMAIFPDGRVVAVYANGHEDHTHIVDGSIELAEYDNAKCEMTIQEDGSLVQSFDLGAVIKRWNRIAPEPNTYLVRDLDQ